MNLSRALQAAVMHPARHFTSAVTETVYDVAVVGSGMVGAALAALLGSNPYTKSLRIIVIDRQVPTFTKKDIPEIRVSTITPATVSILQRCGAWPQIAPPNCAEFRRMQVWCTGGSGAISWDAKDTGVERMGWVVENGMLQQALMQQLGSETVELAVPEQVEGLVLPPPKSAGVGLAELVLKGGRTVHARLVVGADGANSRTRQMAELRTMGWAYPQRGLVATVATSEPNDVAWQRFLPTGPLALLPCRDGFSNIVWSTTPETAQQLETLHPAEFAEAVNKALRDPPSGSFNLGPLSSAQQLPPLVEGWVGSSPKSFPLQMKHAGRYVRSRLALIGDAAHAVHPMAGQGVNLGFGDVGALVEAVAHAVQHGQDIGDERLLKEHYEKPRQRANTSMMAALDTLKAVFAVSTPPLASARNLGLSMLHTAGPLKNRIMQYAMGM